MAIKNVKVSTGTASTAGSVSLALKSSISKEKLLKEIEKKAYELFLNRKGRHGNDLNDWLEAEKIVKKQYKI
ncbi:MAG: hypothetical protein A2452_10965 [Candidatus Firestonebacteria bacterium RIFOXYC2_FULL_39_67]|nr:MAG: hypothetical protein A2536_08865 [Candidatus Firestonebacteria bacterium RIFOXYD2_FULL_39_29]OGF55975.1 MAG: hypothetical protein A2452_10965 [Candidatus Firestonebacteria bacterium RIFOXYC2_FULL_39_67]OGF57805.1 MAG: hypothetical protein A2497_01430 [Candidatus Firestonebacteria bacterium RifOxyC12_full_39_7]